MHKGQRGNRQRVAVALVKFRVRLPSQQSVQGQFEVLGLDLREYLGKEAMPVLSASAAAGVRPGTASTYAP